MQQVIAVDFDGTLCEHMFPEIGEILEENQAVIDKIREYKKNGAMILLWTCREDKVERKYLSEAVAWCKEKNIPIDFANEYPNPGFSGFGIGEMVPCRKIHADRYIDDRNMSIVEIHIEKICRNM